MRSNPLDNTREPRSAAALAVGAAATLVFITGAYFMNVSNEEARIENVRAAVLAAGYGDAVIKPIKGDECWRAREGFTWESKTASGSACAGPRDDVQLYPGSTRPSLSGNYDQLADQRP